MFIRHTFVFAATLVFIVQQLTMARDPISDSKPFPSFIASTDALSSNATLITAKMAPATEFSDASDLSSNAVAAIREVYVWAWPLVYMSNLKKSMQLVRSPGRSGGAPVAPVNSLCMLTDVVSPEFQSVPCPNRDVIYGFGLMDLKEQPVILQVPDFGNRFWLYQIGDHRMESFGQVGKMYGTPSGFVMVVGPDWQGDVPEQVSQVIRSSTNLAYVLPRVLVGNSDAQQIDDVARWQEVLGQIAIYPLSKFNGRMKRYDWNQVRWYPALGRSTRERNKLVQPENFFDDLQRVLSEVETTTTEQPLVELAEQIELWAKANPSRQAALHDLANKIEQETIQPMFDLSSTGQTLPGHWHSVQNGAAFGDDYWTRTAIAKSNPFVNREREAKYYYLENSNDGHLLQGGRNYTVHFDADQLPPADGFWSLTLYNEHHQFHANTARRYAIGNANVDQLKFNVDGSLTIFVGPAEPTDTEQVNWLPSPTDGPFKLYLRLYQPKASALEGRWIPAPCSPSQ